MKVEFLMCGFHKGLILSSTVSTACLDCSCWVRVVLDSLCLFVMVEVG